MPASLFGIETLPLAPKRIFPQVVEELGLGKIFVGKVAGSPHFCEEGGRTLEPGDLGAIADDFAGDSAKAVLPSPYALLDISASVKITTKPKQPIKGLSFDTKFINLSFIDLDLYGQTTLSNTASNQMI